MPATLEKHGDELVLHLSGHPDFKEALARVKTVPGRRYEPEDKTWRFPANEQTAQRLVHTIQPQPDAVTMAWLRGAASKVAEELTSQLPDIPQDALLWKPPEGLALFPFQPAAVDFLASAERVLLADSMGLGKTPMSIGAVQEWRERNANVARDVSTPSPADGPKLVIAGTSKLGDWRDELAIWAPNDPVMVVPGDKPAARRKKMLAEFEREYAPAGGWLVINGEQIRASDTAKLDEDGEPRKHRRKAAWEMKEPWFADPERRWLAKIVDEAHRFKNRTAQQTGGLHQIRAKLIYHLTGTPLITSPDELWALLADLRPDLYEEWSAEKTTYWQFFHTYCESYAVPGRGNVITGVKNADELRFELADKWVRRTKRLLQDLGLLPAKLPARERIVEMKPAQKALYEDATTALWLAIEQDIAELEPEQLAELQKRVGNLEYDVGVDNVSVSRLLPNAAAKYAALKQIATSPALLGGKDESGKLDAVVEQVLDMEGESVVVFTWHKIAAELIAARLAKRRIKVEFMHGDTKQLERTEVVRRYQEGDIQVLVTTIKTGGEGLNLTRGSTGLFAESSERLTDMDQAIDRIWRLGQHDPVSEVIFRSADTVETDKQAPRLRMKEIILGATVGRDREEINETGST